MGALNKLVGSENENQIRRIRKMLHFILDLVVRFLKYKMIRVKYFFKISLFVNLFAMMYVDNFINCFRKTDV